MTNEWIVEPVSRAIDGLIAAAGPYDGLIPSQLALDAPEMLRVMPEAIAGQRNGDRSFLGVNLMHDHPLLKAMRQAGPAVGREDWRDAADRYLDRFVACATDTPTGLFLWGEHAYWHLAERRPGNSYADGAGKTNPPLIHDHLNQAPRWLWDALAGRDRGCVQRFCEGLDWHWTDAERTEYVRHAPIRGDVQLSGPDAPRSCDFPRHSGHYMHDLACGLSHGVGRDDFRQQYRRFLDYWWDRRHASGLCRSESRTNDPKHARLMTETTLSLAVSLLEAAEILERRDSELAALSRDRAGVYLDGVLAAPHEPEAGRFVAGVEAEPFTAATHFTVWGSVYGVGPLGQFALMLARAAALTGRSDLATLGAQAGHTLASAPLPDDVPVPGMDLGVGIELLIELHTQRVPLDHPGGPASWRSAAEVLARAAIDHFFDHRIPRGAIGVDHYESQMRVSYLLHALLRLTLTDTGHAIPGNYTLR